MTLTVEINNSNTTNEESSVTPVPMDTYDPKLSKEERIARMRERRPLITALDARLRELKVLHSATGTTQSGRRKLTPGYKQSRVKILDDRRALSAVQRADHFNLLNQQRKIRMT